MLAFSFLTAFCEKSDLHPDTIPDSITSHPRLLLPKGKEAQIKKNIQTNPSMKIIHDGIIKSAESFLKLPVEKRKMQGRRLLSTSREILKRVFYLSYAYRMTGNERFAARAEKEMLNAAEFSDWNPNHFLDVGEMCVALSIGYDWLFDYLPQTSKDKIYAALKDKGLLPGDKTHALFSTNNWNQICNAGMIYAALATYERDETYSKAVIARSVKLNKLAFKAYAPDGNYPEGLSYWTYGTDFQVMLIAALESAFGTDFGLSSHEGFMDSAKFLKFGFGSSEKLFNYHDSGESSPHPSVAAIWMASKTRDFSSLYTFSKRTLKFSKDRLAPMMPIFGSDINLFERHDPEAHAVFGRGETPVAFVRTSWEEKEGLYLGIKGGSAFANHAHMDAGTFVFDEGETRWVCDIPPVSYNTIETRGIDLWNKKQDSDRWGLLRYSNTSHSVMIANGKRFNVKGYAALEERFDSPEKRGARFNLSPLYAPDLKSASREALIVRDKFLLINDTVETSDSPVKIRWNICTKAYVEFSENERSLIFFSDTKQLHVFAVSSTDYSVKIFPATVEIPNDEALKNVNFVGFEFEVEPNTKANFKVYFVPKETVFELKNDIFK